MDTLAQLLPLDNPRVYAASSLLIVFFLIKFTMIYWYLGRSQKMNQAWIALMALGLFLFFPLYLFDYEGPYWYLGKFTPNVWHNCTSVMVWPFCLLLFRDSLAWIEQSNQKILLRMGFWAVLILLTKPSFLFAFIPVFPIFSILQKKKIDKTAIGFTLLLFLAVWLMKELIFRENIVDPGRNNVVQFFPLATYKLYAQYPILEILASFAFPCIAFLLFGNRLYESLAVKFSLALVVMAFLVYLSIAEVGHRFTDANFYWQIPICLSILYMTIIYELIQKLSQEKLKGKLFYRSLTLLLVFLGHVISGIHYLKHYVESQYYV